jgi:hypothetical protein
MALSQVDGPLTSATVFVTLPNLIPMVCLAVKKMGREPSEVFYIGDSVTDAETAKRAAVPFVAVLSGVTPDAEFADYEAYAVIENLGELPALIPSSVTPSLVSLVLRCLAPFPVVWTRRSHAGEIDLTVAARPAVFDRLCEKE